MCELYAGSDWLLLDISHISSYERVMNAVKCRVHQHSQHPSTPVNTSKSESESQPEFDDHCQFIKMKQKGKRSDYNQQTRYKETTRDERVKIIALKDAGHNWKEIGR